MEQRLFRYIWNRTKRQQLWILAIILASMPATFILLDLPKYIINGPIQGKGFEKEGAVQRYFRLQFDIPGWLPFQGHYDLFRGVELDRMDALYVLSGVFLLLVIISGLFKFYINTFKGQLGERMLQLFRFELFERVLHFPLGEFRRVKPAEIATMIKDEVEPMGGFIGDAFVQPVFLGGQIITALAFILLQNMLLGLIALALVAVQGVIIPRLRRRQLELGRQRQLTARALAGRIGEIVEDMPNVIINDTFAYQRWDVSAQLNKIFIIRYALYRWKFFVKFLNNMIAQFTPFLFYTVGGYLAIKGTLDIGQLVAVISAYKDLPGPVKELIDWDQERMDVEIKYQQVIEQFTMSGHVEIVEHAHANDDPVEMSEEIVISNLSVSDSSGSRIIQNLSMTLRMDEHVAVIGPNGSGGDALVETIARLLPISAGQIQLGGRGLAEWPHAVTGRRVSYVGSDTFFQQSTIQEALLYGLMHAADAADETLTASKRETRRIARQNAFHIDPDKDWIDYAALKIKGPDELPTCLAEVTRLVNFDDEIVGFGVNERLVDVPSADEIKKLLQARHLLKERIAGSKKKKLVETFDRAAYSHQATIAENILFGTPISDGFKFSSLAENEMVRKALAQHKLDEALFETGKEIARTLVDLFADIASDDAMFRDLQLISPAQLPNYRLALKRAAKQNFRQAAEEDRVRFLDVAFGYVEPRDRLGALNDEMRANVVKVRDALIDLLGKEQSDVAIYDPEVFSLQANVLDNLLFGRIIFGIPDADARVKQMVADVLEELDLHQLMFKIGLNFNIGNGGKRLNPGQRQKLALARAILRRPKVLVASRALSSLDSQSQTSILDNLINRACPSNGEDGFGIIWALADPRFANRFDRVLTMEHGALVSDSQVDDSHVDDGDGNKALSEPVEDETGSHSASNEENDHEVVEARVA